jgi:hypothetical protein
MRRKESERRTILNGHNEKSANNKSRHLLRPASVDKTIRLQLSRSNGATILQTNIFFKVLKAVSGRI